ncbi:MAG TPA: response regulator transcription factor [Blastocatellia bacterium]|nr:response regulator transcription factor [Blastocatellia bacterium]
MKVLIVDDSKVVRDRLVSMLSELEDIEVVGQAVDAFSAIDAIPSLNPDVVILDIYMSGSATGMYVLDRIRREPNPPIVIMLTNYSYEQYRKRLLDAGAAFFFDKSTEFERIPEVLKHLLSKIRPFPDRD